MTLFLLLSAALAGDPCPIDLHFAQYTPEWRTHLEDLAALKSRRTWMGLSYREYGGLVKVKAVVPGSPAEAAGLAPGERIAKVNGHAVGSVSEADARFGAADARDTVTLSIDDAEGQRREVLVSRGPADPVFLGLVNAAENTECRDVRIIALTEAQRAAIAAGAFDEQRGFRCDSAHKGVGEVFANGDVIMIRGGRRILLTLPGWKTSCIAVDALDGPNLSLDALTEQLDALTAEYVAFKHANP